MSRLVFALGAFAVCAVVGNIAIKHERAKVIASYDLSTAEALGYDACMSAVSGKKLKSGGSMSSFCGCYIKQGTADFRDEHKAVAGAVLKGVLKNAREADRVAALELITDDHVRGTVMEAQAALMEAATSCVVTAREPMQSRQPVRTSQRTDND